MHSDLETIKLNVRCDLYFHVSEESALILMLRPFRGIQQWIIREVYTITPATPMLESTDSFGNSVQRLLAPVGDFVIETTADVLVKANNDIAPGAGFVEIQYLPKTILSYLLPSRYCESDRFGDMAREITSDALPGYDQAQRLSDWVRQAVQYIPGSSDYPVSAVEVYQRGFGVCRDLAHVCIALCRSISIPARLVAGYLNNLQPMDLHAWVEVYVGNRWYAFDPSQNEVVGGRVIIAFGRDAADVSVFHQFGSGCVLNRMDVQVNLLDNSHS